MIAEDAVGGGIPEDFATGAGADVGEMAGGADLVTAGEVGVGCFDARRGGDHECAAGGAEEAEHAHGGQQACRRLSLMVTALIDSPPRAQPSS